MTQAFNLSQLANNLNTSGQLDATDGLTGATPVANGGTGLSTITANNVILGNGTSSVQVVAPSTSGNVLTSNGTTWVSSTPAGGGVTSLNGQTGAITNTSLYAIGSYIHGRPRDVTSYATNATVSGSNLYSTQSLAFLLRSSKGAIVWLYANGTSGNPVVSLVSSGTWRCIGGSPSIGGTYGNLSLWVRIS